MIKCKQALEGSSCGKDICCYYCELNETCKDACVTMSPDCGDAFKEENALTVMKQEYSMTIQAISDLMTVKKQVEKEEKKLKEKLLEAMERYGIDKFDNDLIKVVRVKATTKTAIDSKKLKEELPSVYAKYSKISNVSAYVKIEVKE